MLVLVQHQLVLCRRMGPLPAIETRTDAAAHPNRHRLGGIGDVHAVGIDHLGGMGDVTAQAYREMAPGSVVAMPPLCQ